MSCKATGKERSILPQPNKSKQNNNKNTFISTVNAILTRSHTPRAPGTHPYKQHRNAMLSSTIAAKHDPKAAVASSKHTEHTQCSYSFAMWQTPWAGLHGCPVPWRLRRRQSASCGGKPAGSWMTAQQQALYRLLLLRLLPR
jgi:hypothetical protein